MNTLTLKRLMFFYPEPEAAGGGSEAAPVDVASAEPSEAAPAVDSSGATEVDPFDFNNISEPTETESEEQSAEAEEYVLSFGGHYDGDDETTKFITEAAKANGLSAKQASAFVEATINSIYEKQMSYKKQATEELRAEWGAKFDTNARRVGAQIKSAADRLGLDDNTRKALMNPTVYRLVNELTKGVGEQSAVGASNATQPMTDKDRLNSILYDDDNPKRKIWVNLEHPERGKVVKEVNELSQKIFGYKIL